MTHVSYPKTKTHRSEPLRRLVAKLECQACGVEGFTQAAHVALPGGGAIKSSDAGIAALCCDRIGARGCHAMLDQGGKMPRDERRQFEAEMALKTLVALIERGYLIPNPKAKS